MNVKYAFRPVVPTKFMSVMQRAAGQLVTETHRQPRWSSQSRETGSHMKGGGGWQETTPQTMGACVNEGVTPAVTVSLIQLPTRSTDLQFGGETPLWMESVWGGGDK